MAIIDLYKRYSTHSYVRTQFAIHQRFKYFTLTIYVEATEYNIAGDDNR